MDDRRERAKSNVRDLVTAAAERGRGGGAIRIRGSKNIVAGGDVDVNQRVVKRVEYTPDDRHIAPEMARQIQDRVRKLADIEVVAGATKHQAFARWCAALNRHLDVPSYKLIPSHLGDEAVQWLVQQAAIMRPKLRRQANPKWRNEHYGAIWAAARQLGLSKGEVYGLVHERLGKRVTSLKQLGERNLQKLYRILMGMKRG